MTEEELLEKIGDTIQTLYQNKEIEGLEKVKELFPVFQSMLQERAAVGVSDEVLSCFSMLKELVVNFQDQNMLGMADCLEEKAVSFIQYYYQSAGQSMH